MGTGTYSPNVINFVFLFVNYININVRFVWLTFSKPSRMTSGSASMPLKFKSITEALTCTKAAMTNSPNKNSDYPQLISHYLYFISLYPSFYNLFAFLFIRE